MLRVVGQLDLQLLAVCAQLNGDGHQLPACSHHPGEHICEPGAGSERFQQLDLRSRIWVVVQPVDHTQSLPANCGQQAEPVAEILAGDHSGDGPDVVSVVTSPDLVTAPDQHDSKLVVECREVGHELLIARLEDL